MVPHAIVVVPLERLSEVLPRARAREERLRDVERQPVLVGVEEPGGDIVALAILRLHRRRVEGVEPEQLDLVALPAAFLLSPSLTRPQVAVIRPYSRGHGRKGHLARTTPLLLHWSGGSKGNAALRDLRR